MDDWETWDQSPRKTDETSCSAAAADSKVEPGKTFQTERKVRTYATLTSVQLTSKSISQIVSNLGVAYDVMKMIDTQHLDANARRFQVHVDLLKAMQDAGLAKIGLPGQEFITEKNKPKWSKATLTKLVSSNKTLPSTLNQILMRTGSSTLIAEDMVEWMKQMDKASNASRFVSVVLDHILGKKDFIECEGAAKELEARRTACKWRLDPWQNEMTAHITQGRSVLVNGPTSGGKTFASMVAIDWLLTKRADVRLAYVAPTFHLAMQTYANIKLTFPQAVSLITGVANAIVTDAQVWVGTPAELWNYLQATNTTFSIGIFDEIHMLGASYSSDKLHRLRAEAMTNLLGLCKDQVIALSATIHADDIPVLQKYISERTGIASIATVVYTERPVPSTSLAWTDGKLVRMETGASAGSSTRAPEESKSKMTGAHIDQDTDMNVTPEATFALLRCLNERDMLPGLVFDATEKACYDAFVEYMGWIQDEEARVYATWHKLHDTLGADITRYNATVAPIYAEYSEAYSMNRSITTSKENKRDPTAKSGKTNALKEVLPRMRQYSKQRGQLVEVIMTTLRNEIVKMLDKKSKYMVNLPPELGGTLKRLKAYGEFKVPSTVSAECRDLIREWQTFANVAFTTEQMHESAGENPPPPDVIGSLPQVAESVGPLFRVGARVADVDSIRNMLVPGTSAANWKLHKSMLALCQAERIRPAEVEPLFKLLARGLEYGVALILPSIPFAAQYEMLRLLSKRSIKVIFTSQSMSMGVNYPVRSAVIRMPRPSAIDVMMYMQMSGRAGRRRLDDRAYVVAWNVTNAASANISTLPRIVLPEHGPERGSLVPNALEMVMHLDESRKTILGQESKADSSRAMNAAAVLDVLCDASGALDKDNPTNPDLEKDSAQVQVPAADAPKKKIHKTKSTLLKGSRPEKKSRSGRAKAKVDKKARSQKETLTQEALDATGVIAAVTSCIRPLAPILGLTETDVTGMTDRITCVTRGQLSSSARQDTYAWVEKMNLCKTALAELHTHYHRSQNTEWLDYVSNVYEILHRVGYRLLRL